MGKHIVSMIVAMCLASLTSGCALHLVPYTIQPLDTNEGLPGPFNNITVTLVNAQADDSDFSVKYLNGKDRGFVVNRKFWTEKFAEALGAELTTRQAKVVDGAPVIVYLKVTNVNFTPIRSYLQFRVTASVTLNSGWTKTYVGNGDASVMSAPFAFGSSGPDRASNWTIRDLVRAIMSDPEFIAEISKQK